MLAAAFLFQHEYTCPTLHGCGRIWWRNDLEHAKLEIGWGRHAKTLIQDVNGNLIHLYPHAAKFFNA